jgi:hypothetical protein
MMMATIYELPAKPINQFQQALGNQHGCAINYVKERGEYRSLIDLNRPRDCLSTPLPTGQA